MAQLLIQRFYSLLQPFYSMIGTAILYNYIKGQKIN
jgi:hypothetical protein